VNDTGPSIRLVIFDCDGVLVDSEPIAMRVLIETLAEQGLTVEEDRAYRDFLGRSLATVRSQLRDAHQVELDDGALQAMRDRLFEEFRANLLPTPGVAEALATITGNHEVSVASSSHPERIRLSLQIAGLDGFFGEHIHSATEVRKGKPAPDLFLHAAAARGVPPENCLVIEDSPAGIEAARAAGMRVFAYVGGTHVKKAGLGERIAAAGADAVIEDMRDLPAMVAGLSRPARSRTGGQSEARTHYVAVDVGTASVRAGIVDDTGALLMRVEHPINVHREGAERGEYSSTEIWSACCSAVREAVARAGCLPGDMAGIGFDATCSLVVLDADGHPLPVSNPGRADCNTIAWFDHRALAEAEEATATGHPVLEFSGWVLSPEMEVPKLMWLKRHMPDTWRRAAYLMDLADFLTFCATGSVARSQSTLTAKWAYLGHEQKGWHLDFFEAVGIGDLFERSALPPASADVGDRIGTLSQDAADALGLTTDCVVATGMIDAHAGALGVLGNFLGDPRDLHRHLGLIAGTSSCVMALSAEPRPIHGVWGPYYGAVLPEVWLNEGGQSATGALLDHVIRLHAAGGEPDGRTHTRIIERVAQLRAEEGSDFAKRLHVLPDFHGNRSPLAEPDAVGVISGLTLDTSFDSLCRLYWRTAVGIALGLRHILEAFNANGYGIDTLHITGGHTRNPLLMELYADATGCEVMHRADVDALLVGTAMTAASAAGTFESLPAACAAMSGQAIRHMPDPNRQPEYDEDYAVFLAMHRHRREIDGMQGGIPLAVAGNA